MLSRDTSQQASLEASVGVHTVRFQCFFSFELDSLRVIGVQPTELELAIARPLTSARLMRRVRATAQSPSHRNDMDPVALFFLF